MDEIFGIDLGTTNTVAAVNSNDAVPTLIPLSGPNNFLLPSCVMYNGNGVFVVGKEAYEKRYKSNVAYSAKRYLGSDKVFKLTVPETGESIELKPYEVSAHVLRRVKDAVAEYYKPLTKCVITVPAYFSQLQIEETVEASKLAGLECVYIAKEPTAAAVLQSTFGNVRNGTVLIYDLGGGTFDASTMNFVLKNEVSIEMLKKMKEKYGIEVESNDSTDKYFCRVLGTYGDTRLGGDDVDKIFADRVLGGMEVSKEEYERILLMCESAKKSRVEIVTEVNGKKLSIGYADREYAEDVVFNRTLDVIKDIDFSEITSVTLVGGSTKSESIKERLRRCLPGIEVSTTVDPDTSVALGATVIAKQKQKDGTLSFIDVLPVPIGVLIGNKIEPLLKRNAQLPCSTMRKFFTSTDNQEIMILKFYQGLSSSPSKSDVISTLEITDLPKAKAREVSISVYVTVNAMNTLTIKAVVDQTGQEFVAKMNYKVKKEKKSRKSEDRKFEEALKPLLIGNKEAMDLLKRRRESDSEEERANIDALLYEML